jgi:hypothetical protein
MLTPLFAIVLDASAARAAARSSQVDPLDALSVFEGDWLCEAKRVGLLMPLAELPTQPASDGPNGAHGYVRARRVLNNQWLTVAFFEQRGGGDSGESGDPAPGEGDSLFQRGARPPEPRSEGLVGYDVSQGKYVNFAFADSGAYGVATADAFTDGRMEWKGAIRDRDGKELHFRKVLAFNKAQSAFSVSASVSPDGTTWTDHGHSQCNKLTGGDHGGRPDASHHDAGRP